MAARILALSSFRVKSAIRFFPRLSESISDLVSRAESDEIIGFVGGEGGWSDAESFVDFRAMAGLYFPHERLGGPELFDSAGVHQHKNRSDGSSVKDAVIIQIRKGATHGCHIVYQDVVSSGSDETLELRTAGKPLHGICSGVKDLINLDDIDIGFSPGNHCRSGGEDLRNGIVSRGLAGMRSDETRSPGKLDFFIKKMGKGKVCDQMNGGNHVPCLRRFVLRMGL